MGVPRSGSTCFSSINCDVQSLHSFSSSASGTSFSGIFPPYHFRCLFAWSSMLASQHDCLRNTQASSVRFECCSVDFPEESSLFVLHLVRAQVISVLVFPAAFCTPVRSILPTRFFPPLQVSDSTCCSQVMLLVQLHPPSSSSVKIRAGLAHTSRFSTSRFGVSSFLNMKKARSFSFEL